MRFEQRRLTGGPNGQCVCNSWIDAINPRGEFPGTPFDVVVLGAGMHGGYCAEKIYRFAQANGKRLRILVLDAGSLLLTPREPGQPRKVTSNLNDPGLHEVVWGYPWRSNEAFPGLAFCVGGRSLYWGGWAPRLTSSDGLNDWPADVKSHLLLNYPEVEREIGITAARHEPLSAALVCRFAAAAGPGMTVEAAPIAAQSAVERGAIFSFNRYSSASLLIDAVREDVLRDPASANRQLLLVPHVNVTRLLNDGTTVTGIEVRVNGQRNTISVGRELKPHFKVVLATSTIESTRLALNSFPANGMGANLMAHLRSDTVITIPRSELGLGSPTDLEMGMALIRGDVPVSGGKTRHFHLQVTAVSNLSGTPESYGFFRNFLDTGLLQGLMKAQSSDTVIMVVCAVGELSSDRSMTPPEGPKDQTKSWVTLTDDPNNLEFGDTRRAWVNLVMNSDDAAVSLAMNEAVINLAGNVAKDPAKAAVHLQRDVALGSCHHEAGTLFMGSPGSSVTDKDGKFHHISNAFVAGPALFTRIGSANPSLTAMALARNTAQVIVSSLS